MTDTPAVGRYIYIYVDFNVRICSIMFGSIPGHTWVEKQKHTSKLEVPSLRSISPIFSYLRVILGLFRDYIDLVLAYLC